MSCTKIKYKGYYEILTDFIISKRKKKKLNLSKEKFERYNKTWNLCYKDHSVNRTLRENLEHTEKLYLKKGYKLTVLSYDRYMLEEI